MPPPITTIFGPLSYTVLLNISDFRLTLSLFSILSSLDSINTSNVLLFKNTNPTTIATNPIANIAITSPTSAIEISFITNTFASP